jgi:hypothetical protein
MKDYHSTPEELISPSYGKTMRHNRYLHILRFLSFSNNDNASDNKDSNYDRPWKEKHIVTFMNDN